MAGRSIILNYSNDYLTDNLTAQNTTLIKQFFVTMPEMAFSKTKDEFEQKQPREGHPHLIE